MRMFAPFLISCLLLVAPAKAQEGEYAEILLGLLHPGDAEAMAGWEETLAGHLKTLRTEREETLDADAADTIETLVATERLAFTVGELEGDWRVRSLQTDGLGAYVYQFFPASIAPEALAMIFDKNSGSQRHRGVLAQWDEETVFFAGAMYYHYDVPRLYSTMMADAVTPDLREHDAIAQIHKIGENHFLMAFAPRDGEHFRFYEIVAR